MRLEASGSGYFITHLSQWDDRTLVCTDGEKIQKRDANTLKVIEKIPTTQVDYTVSISAVARKGIQMALYNDEEQEASTIQIWNLETSTHKTSLQYQNAYGVSSMTFLNENLLVAASDYGALTFWNIEERKEIKTLKHDGATIRNLVVYDTKMMSTAGQVGDNANPFPGQLTLWDTETGTSKHLSNDGSLGETSIRDHLLAVATAKKGTEIWDLRMETRVNSFKKSDSQTSAILWSPTQTDTVIAGQIDANLLEIWDSRKTDEPVELISTTHSPISLCSFNQDLVLGTYRQNTNGEEVVVRYTDRPRAGASCILL